MFVLIVNVDRIDQTVNKVFIGQFLYECNETEFALLTLLEEIHLKACLRTRHAL